MCSCANGGIVTPDVHHTITSTYVFDLFQAAGHVKQHALWQCRNVDEYGTFERQQPLQT